MTAGRSGQPPVESVQDPAGLVSAVVVTAVLSERRELGALTPADRLEVSTAAERVTLLHPPGHDYYRLLRSKLRWGRGSFEH